MTIQIYQTLEDRNNPQDIAINGPFKCTRSDAWLGDGFYFWENYIEHAHWWGSKGYNNNYIICSAQYDHNPSYCFDLINNYEHLSLLEDLYHIVKAKTSKPVLVSKIIELLKKQTTFDFDAVRAPSQDAKSEPLYIKYKSIHKAKIYLRPLNQICFFRKNNRLNLRDFQIIYPPQYVDGYVV